MKAAGALILAVIPVVLFYRWGEELRLKEKQRKAFFKLLVHIRFQIENFSRDQKEIFKRFSDPVLERTDFFNALKQELERRACGAFGEVWRKHGADFGFDASTAELLDPLAEHFGLQEKNAQLAELGRAIELLEKTEKARNAECENKIKILRISGLTAGLGILILLI